MPAIYSPDEDGILGTNWTVVPAGSSFFEAVNDPPDTPDDGNYLSHAVSAGGGTGTDAFVLRYPLTEVYGVDYGDGTSSPAPVSISSVTFNARIKTVFGATPVPMAFYYNNVVGQTSATTVGPFTLPATDTLYHTYTHTMTTNPYSGAAWTAADLRGLVWGLQKTGAAGNTILCSLLHVTIVESWAKGGGRARRKPRLGEPSLYCTICSRPFHVSELIKVPEPRHPNYNQWVCHDDYDEVDYENIEPETGITEGDIDFDL